MFVPPAECPLCGSRQLLDFFRIANAPVSCASIFGTREAALAVPSGRIDLSACARCTFIFNRSFDPSLGAIAAQYESSQAASSHFSAFAQGLAREWVERYSLRGARVLEVGCGGGDFLERLLQEGVESAIGVDPCCNPSAQRSNRIELIQDVFDVRRLELSADALVCRHTLEHVHDPLSLLRVIRSWAARGETRPALFELPGSERVIAERAFWDVYYEHCNYFTARTLRTALQGAGFAPRRIDHAYEGQYLIAEAMIAAAAGRAACSEDGATDELLQACEAFGHETHLAIGRCMERLGRLATPARPLVIWQGASKTVGFLTALPDCSMIAYAVDLSPQRQGMFLPGSGLPVCAPQALLEAPPEHIILMNPVYLREVRAHVGGLGLRSQVHSVNELLAK